MKIFSVTTIDPGDGIDPEYPSVRLFLKKERALEVFVGYAKEALERVCSDFFEITGYTEDKEKMILLCDEGKYKEAYELFSETFYEFESPCFNEVTVEE